MDLTYVPPETFIFKTKAVEVWLLLALFCLSLIEVSPRALFSAVPKVCFSSEDSCDFT